MRMSRAAPHYRGAPTANPWSLPFAHKPIFAEDKRFVFFCGGGWRSALATKTLRAVVVE